MNYENLVDMINEPNPHTSKNRPKLNKNICAQIVQFSEN
jgi:hypothetical protein